MSKIIYVYYDRTRDELIERGPEGICSLNYVLLDRWEEYFILNHWE